MIFVRSTLYFALLLACILAAAEQARAADARARFTINDGWTFIGSDVPDGQENAFDTAGWEKVNLPHTWNIADTLDDEPGYRRGISWYRKQLDLDHALSGKRIFLYFEGVNQTAELFVNEKHVGGHIGGYTAFVFDITELVRFSGPNLIAVKVDNSLNKDIPPLDADFNMHGGIYRDVWIIAANDAHFKITDMAGPGIVVRTPDPLARESAAIAVRTAEVSGSITNTSARARKFEILTTVFDKDGAPVVSTRSELEVPARGEAGFKHPPLRVQRPKLWSPDDPYLYSVRSVLRENGRVLDELNEPLGFRSYRFDPAEGFFLNGEPLKLRGTNRHQDRAGFGNAVPDNLQVRDLEIIKENGFNFVRLAHYPQDPSVLAAADRLGLMLWEEIPIVNLVNISEAFNRNSETMLREMIRQHRNHPSVILWGYMNEIFLAAPKTEEYTKATVELAKRLEKVVDEEDPGRMTAIAFDRGDASDRYHASGLGEVTDVIGWNLYFGWYYGVFDDLGKFMDDQHRRFPNRPQFISEYGANADRRVHSTAPVRFDSTTEWQRMYHESYLRQMNERKFISGGAVWNMFDFSSEFRGDTIPHINQKGLLTYDRMPKDVLWLYKASFVSTPVLHIAVRDWPVRSGSNTQTVDIYTNLAVAELFVNGVSAGRKNTLPSHGSTWNVTFRPGLNSLVARGTKAGAAITDEATVKWIDPADMSDIGINAGATFEYIHETGSMWHADRPYTPGGWGYTGDASKVISNLRNILATDLDAVAQTAREGTFEYRFDVADGEYDLELWFAELKNIKTGERVFDVLINGNKAIASLDLVKEAGPFTILKRKFRISARDQSGLKIAFEPIKGQPILSGLRLLRIK